MRLGGFVGQAVMLSGVLAAAAPVVSLVLAPTLPMATFPVSLEGKRWPVYGGGVIVVAEGPMGEPAGFSGYDRSGKIVFSWNFSIPGAAKSPVYSYARGAEGTLALCGISIAPDGRRAPYIAWFSPGGQTQKVIRTSPYHAFHVAVANDGTLWAVGLELNAGMGEKDTNVNAHVLRHYSRDGRLLASFLPRSGFRSMVAMTGEGFLAASRDRTGWLYSVAPEKDDGAYVEVSRDGELTQYALPAMPAGSQVGRYSSMALTSGGDVLIFADPADKKESAALLALDRGARAWKPVDLRLEKRPRWLYLYGGDDDVALYAAGDPKSAVRFFAPVREPGSAIARR